MVCFWYNVCDRHVIIKGNLLTLLTYFISCQSCRRNIDWGIPVTSWQRYLLKLEFHDADTHIDTDTDSLARILADTSDTRDFLKLFLRQSERHADILATIHGEDVGVGVVECQLSASYLYPVSPLYSSASARWRWILGRNLSVFTDLMTAMQHSLPITCQLRERKASVDTRSRNDR